MTKLQCLQRWQLSKTWRYLFETQGRDVLQNLLSRGLCRAGQAARLGPCLLHLSVCFWVMVRPGDKPPVLALASNARLWPERDGLFGSSEDRLLNFLIAISNQQESKSVWAPLERKLFWCWAVLCYFCLGFERQMLTNQLNRKFTVALKMVLLLSEYT